MSPPVEASSLGNGPLGEALRFGMRVLLAPEKLFGVRAGKMAPWGSGFSIGAFNRAFNSHFSTSFSRSSFFSRLWALVASFPQKKGWFAPSPLTREDGVRACAWPRKALRLAPRKARSGVRARFRARPFEGLALECDSTQWWIRRFCAMIGQV